MIFQLVAVIKSAIRKFSFFFLFIYNSLQRRHMRIMTSQISDKLTVCWRACIFLTLREHSIVGFFCEGPHSTMLIQTQGEVNVKHCSDVTKVAMTSQITNLTIVYSTVYSRPDQRKHQSSASLAFVRGIHQWPLNSPHKWPVTRKIFPFYDVIMFM